MADETKLLAVARNAAAGLARNVGDHEIAENILAGTRDKYAWVQAFARFGTPLYARNAELEATIEAMRASVRRNTPPYVEQIAESANCSEQPGPSDGLAGGGFTAMSSDLHDSRTLRLHFKTPVSDGTRAFVLSALNAALTTREAVVEECAKAPSGMSLMRQEIAADPEQAWAVHRNLAVPIMDAIGCAPEQANEAAAHLMQHLFDCDISQHPHYEYGKSGAQSYAEFRIAAEAVEDAAIRALAPAKPTWKGDPGCP